jgi:hypothetical protein
MVMVGGSRPTYWAASLKAWLREDSSSWLMMARTLLDWALGFEGLEFGHLGLEAGGVGLDVIGFVAGLHAEGVVDAEGGLAAVLVPAL